MDDKSVSNRTSFIVPALLGTGLLLGVGFVGGYWAGGGDIAVSVSPDVLAANPNESTPIPVPTAKAQRFLAPQGEFIRLQKDAKKEPTSLDVAISQYRPKNGDDVSVTLVGAVHVADKQYFTELNKELAGYDVVLYELVAPKDTRPSPQPTGSSKDVLSMVQYGLTDLLEVTHQLDEIDYHKPNFVHADLSMDELQKEGQARGETQFTLFAGIALDAMRLAQKADSEAAKAAAQPNAKPTPAPDMLSMISDPNTLRKEFAKSLAQGDMKDGVPGFTSLTPYLIDARNQAVIDALKHEIAAGKKNIAIFYGAAHLPDFEKRLNRDFAMQRVETRWLRAWDLTRALPKKDPLGLLMKLLSSAQQP